MQLELEGSAALVGGSSRGIGKAIAFALAREGCKVAICARDEAKLTAAADELRRATGGTVAAITCDMSKPDDIKRTVTEAAATFGRLDIVVNNAGGPPTGTFDDFDDAAWQRALEQNLMSTIRTIREARPHLRASGHGRILNITSVAVKQPIDRLILSNTARLGVIGMAKTLSRELAPEGITVNNICPGNIATDRLLSLIAERARRGGIEPDEAARQDAKKVPVGFLGEPDDVANLAVFLASRRARYITGATIQVDGGTTAALF
jgi:3-oxoacyl-[acyl-carrier protein] reductase